MTILNFLIANWDSVLVSLLTRAILVILYIKGQKNIVNKILYSLVTEAEKQFGGGTGELKQAHVIKKVYEALPSVLKTFISADRLGRWVDKGLTAAKEKWAKNSSVSGYIEGASKEVNE